eukprot:12885839-Prorocentrum_lima.AAC.1
MDKGTQLSADLYAYFPLEGGGLNDEQKRLVVMCANNKYEATAFIRTLETNYFDLHITEQRQRHQDTRAQSFVA